MVDIVQYAILFRGDGLDAGIAEPTRVSFDEGLSELPRCEVDLRYPGSTPLEVRGLLRKDAEVLVLRKDNGEVIRKFPGLVTKVREKLTNKADLQLFTVTLGSPLFVLSLSSDYKIYQEKTTKDIVSDILAAAGLGEAVTWNLTGSYTPREVCTQWGESTLSFVMRILEEDGIFFFTSHEDSKIVFGDDAGAYPPIPGSPDLQYARRTESVEDEAITKLLQRGRIRPAKVTFIDHDFKKPSLDLTAEATSDSALNREHYFYPGRYVDPGEGKRLAKVMMDAIVSDAMLVQGESGCFRMVAGHTFGILEGPAWSEGVTWVARRVRHTWSLTMAGSGEHVASFELFDKTKTFRPPRLTPRPRVWGPQSATVTGPAGEEIHCDEFGRIKVQFTWDRYGKQDDKSSGWVRVGQMHTSGSVVIPRIGWEVLVEFEDGDPDKPIVTGKLFNGAGPPPSALPGEKATSALTSYSSPGGGGHNEISMGDGGGSEVISVHAEKDLNLVVANNKEEKITTNVSVGIGSNQAQKIGANQTIQIGAKETIDVGGNQKHTVGAARTKTVSGDEKLDVKGARSNTIGASHTIMTPMAATCTTSGDFSETVGASCLEVAALGVSLAVAGSCSITVGAAKVEAVASGKTDMTIGARASTIGGALLNISGAGCSTATKGAKATTVGGAWLAAAGGDAEFSSGAGIKINVGGAVIMNGAKIVLKVGGSTVSLSAGAVVLDSSEVKLTASGPNAELAPMVGSK